MINLGSKIEACDSKIFGWLMFIYPFFLFFLGYIYAEPYFEENSDVNLGMIIGAVILLSSIPILLVIFSWLLKKKKYSDKKKVFIYYGISIALFMFLLLGQFAQKL